MSKIPTLLLLLVLAACAPDPIRVRYVDTMKSGMEIMNQSSLTADEKVRQANKMLAHRAEYESFLNDPYMYTDIKTSALRSISNEASFAAALLLVIVKHLAPELEWCHARSSL